MRKLSMAVVFPVNGASTEGQIWTRTSQLLLGQLGKRYTHFMPSSRAWGQNIERPYGVIFGRRDPALFLYFLGAAKKMQNDATHFHLAGFLQGLQPIAKDEQEGFAIYSMEVKGDGKEMAPHMFWEISMLSGEILPDCGIYLGDQNRSVMDEETNHKILCNLPNYALCVVSLTPKEAADE